MVRRIVGTLVDVGRRRTTVEGALMIFNSRDISQAKTLAPAGGLILEAVRYNE
jgi:tRNA U38,U39,U40 pseudouridine synthase TruA